VQKHTINKKNIITKIRHYLSDREQLVFAYIYGSFVQRDRYRDIDIAAYFETEPSLLALGCYQVEVEKVCQLKVDFTILNDLPAKKPALAHEIVNRGKLIVNKTPSVQVDYKRDAMLSYFDTHRFRKMMDEAFRRRLNTGKFGKRNYE
jgi:predicted nucleotidyltransferase